MANRISLKERQALILNMMVQACDQKVENVSFTLYMDRKFLSVTEEDSYNHIETIKFECSDESFVRDFNNAVDFINENRGVLLGRIEYHYCTPIGPVGLDADDEPKKEEEEA